jgi:hypothetical protein
MNIKYIIFALAAILIAIPAHADDGFYNQPGWSDSSDSGDTKYFHYDSGETGWQTRIGDNVYYHSNRRNCMTNGGSPSQTSCVDY